MAEAAPAPPRRAGGRLLPQPPGMVTLQCPRFCCRFAVLQAGFQGEFGGAALGLRRFFCRGTVRHALFLCLQYLLIIIHSYLVVVMVRRHCGCAAPAPSTAAAVPGRLAVSIQRIPVKCANAQARAAARQRRPMACLEAMRAGVPPTGAARQQWLPRRWFAVPEVAGLRRERR